MGEPLQGTLRCLLAAGVIARLCLVIGLQGPPFLPGTAARALLNGDEITGPVVAQLQLFFIDGLLTSVGSTNFDNRSLHLSDEATLNIVDADFASAQTDTFEADLALAHRVSDAECQARPHASGWASGWYW